MEKHTSVFICLFTKQKTDEINKIATMMKKALKQKKKKSAPKSDEIVEVIRNDNSNLIMPAECSYKKEKPKRLDEIKSI